MFSKYVTLAIMFAGSTLVAVVLFMAYHWWGLLAGLALSTLTMPVLFAWGSFCRRVLLKEEP